ncbi:lysylphosphatidylglycerol synthase domain-containing protein [Methylobacterium oryzihabitans]|uniref:TIGR00374 family protein n=1 Tax=Methylobacterium oryzihabitans TaxID=2499852 RepID=A0A3S2V2K9_9HYPH|nr:lysylphosphatidylglycerol synthase domain-containing protein [Methylobacterium oryzihabitans]RVU13792.1 TIGR00374 family protein [Methylobacterium oryzihabitans]
MTAPAPRRIGRAILRRIPLVGALAGIGLAVWLVASNDVGAVADAFGRVGLAGIGAVVLVRLAILVLCGLAWARVLAGLTGVTIGPFLLLRFVREGINVLLPVASVGGEVLGARLLTFWGVGGALSAAGILVDMFFQVVTEAVFAATGVLLLAQLDNAQAAVLAQWCAKGLALSAVVLAAFFAVQRFGGAGFVEARIAALVRRFAAEDPATAPDGTRGGVQAALDAAWDRRRWRPLADGFLLHLAAWFLGAAEIWIALRCLGFESVGFAEAVVLESLSQAIKSAAFPVPSGLGVQEGGFVLLGSLFGIDAHAALALSLVKRVPDVVLGLPALLLWQAIEARRGLVARQQG